MNSAACRRARRAIHLVLGQQWRSRRELEVRRGAATPRADIDLIRKRLRDATADAKGQKP